MKKYLTSLFQRSCILQIIVCLSAFLLSSITGTSLIAITALSLWLLHYNIYNDKDEYPLALIVLVIMISAWASGTKWGVEKWILDTLEVPRIENLYFLTLSINIAVIYSLIRMYNKEREKDKLFLEVALGILIVLVISTVFPLPNIPDI